MWPALLAGFALGGSLIVAIGAQNAFVIRQGVLDQHVFWICLFCSASDVLLIWAGTYGLAGVLSMFPAFITIMRYGGAAFLIWYGLQALQRARHPVVLGESTCAVQSLSSGLAMCAALTWLNPHVYLDTVALVGSLANARPADAQAPFALGASLASFSWFFALGYGAKALRAPLSRPAVWRGIDLVIAAIMLWLAIKLIMGF